MPNASFSKCVFLVVCSYSCRPCRSVAAFTDVQGITLELIKRNTYNEGRPPILPSACLPACKSLVRDLFSCCSPSFDAPFETRGLIKIERNRLPTTVAAAAALAFSRKRRALNPKRRRLAQAPSLFPRRGHPVPLVPT